MKRILITGKNSYIGNNLEKWLGNFPNKYVVKKISLRNDSWKEQSFSDCDVVVHVAGLAHTKETKENAHLYYKVNRDLAYEVAKKAKIEGVKQFIFLSSMSVYGIDSGVINLNTPLKPKNNYGKSKLQAEKLISSLDETSFKIAIIRPPMIYGAECKGNYSRLANFVIRLPFFPDIDNKRSMIHIDNLCEFLRLVIEDNSRGVFFPQNKEYVCTAEMVKSIVETHGKTIKLIKVFNPLIYFFQVGSIRKMFGDLVYEKNISKINREYCVYDFKESIILTESRRFDDQ